MTFDQTWYAVGTASVSNGSTTVTGQNTNWLSGGIIPGDYVLAAGELVPILTVNSNTSITLTDGWPGTTRATDSYKIIPASDAVRVLTATRAVLSLLLNGNVNALSSLTLAANKGIHATGAGVLATFDQTAFGRAIQALTGANGAFIRATGAGSAAMQTIVGTVSQSSGAATGAMVERGSNVNGEYARFADGTQICAIQLFPNVPVQFAAGSWAHSSAVPWTFPASFIGPPVVSASLDLDQNSFVDAFIGSTFDTNSFATGMVILSSSAKANTNFQIQAVAIGRWF